MKGVNKGQQYKLVPPEGGWGYAIAAGKVLTFLSLFGVMNGFGLIFNDFLKEIGVSTSIVAILGSFSSGAMSIAGLFSNVLGQQFSNRSVGVFAAIGYCAGSFFQVFATSTLPLFVASALHGAAIGIMLPIVFSSFNQYFVDRRNFMTSATQIVIGLGHVGAPIGVQLLLENYGFRGCLAILTAINFHSIVGMLVMHPVEWHMKKVEIESEESEKPEEKQLLNGETDQDQPLKTLVLEKSSKTHIRPPTSRKCSKAKSIPVSRRTSFAAVTDWAGSVVISDAVEMKSRKDRAWDVFKKSLDLNLLKELPYINMVLGIMLTFYADFSLISFQPLYLFELNYSQVDVSRIIAVGTAADLVARCIFTGVAAFVTISPKLIYFVAIILTIVARYVFFFIFDFWGMVAITAVIGFLRAWFHVPVGLIFAEYLPNERFASGYGLYMFLQGMFTLAIGPFIRFVHSINDSYTSVFHILNIFMIINIIIWSTEHAWHHCRKKDIAENASNQQPTS